MLNIVTDHPPCQHHAGTSPWGHLTVSQRVARVIERCRTGIHESVTEADFQREPETAELTLDEVRANIGRASILLLDGAPEPTYSRAERVAQGAMAVLGKLPNRVTIVDLLMTHGFPRQEAQDLAGDIVDQAGEHWRKHGAMTDDLPGWGRRQLERNAN
jgi:hypothetical protein